MTEKEIIETLVDKFADEVCGACSYSDAACSLEENGYRDEARKMLEMAKAEQEHANDLYEMIRSRVSAHVGKASAALQ